MAEENIILKVGIDTEQMQKDLSAAIKSVNDLRVKQRELTKEIIAGNDVDGKMAKQLAQVSAELEKNQREVKSKTAVIQAATAANLKENATLDEQRQALAQLQKAAALMTEEQRKMDVGGSTLEERIKSLTDSIKEQEHAIGDDRRNVGNYTESIQKALPSLDAFGGKLSVVGVNLGEVAEAASGEGGVKDAMKVAGNGVKDFGKQLMSLLANPIVAILAAVVVVVQQLAEAFKRNEDAMTALDKVAAPFKAVWQTIQRLFDDMVSTILSVYNSMEKASGSFSYFNAVLMPIKVTIAAIRVQFAMVSTLMKGVAEGIAYLAESAQKMVSGSVVGKFIDGIVAKVKSLFASIDNFLKKAANSSIGKRLGLDQLYNQLHEILGAQNELTAANRKIAEMENALNKQRRDNLQKNADDEIKIAKLKADSASKDKFSAQERLAMIEQAAKLEQGIADRKYEDAKKQYELVKAQNALTGSGKDDLDAEADAYAAMVNAQKEAYNKQKELNAQIAGFREELEKAGKSLEKQHEAELKALDALRKELEKRKRTDLENELAAIEEQKQKELAVVGLTEQEKQQIIDYYNDLSAKKKADSEKAILEAKQKAREEFGIEKGKTPEEKELALLAAAREQDLLNADEYEYAKTLIQQKYSKQRQEQLDKEVKEARKQYEAAVKSTANTSAAAMSALSNLLGEYAEESEEAAKAQKAFAFGAILINQAMSIAEGAKGIAAAMAGAAEAAAATGAAAPIMLPIYTAEMVGQVLAMVASVASTIVQSKQLFSQSNSAGKYEQGGIVGGTSYTGDKLTANVNSAEMILTRQQQSRLFDIANGGMSGSNYEAMKAAMSAAVAEMPAPNLAITEFNEAQKRVTTITEIAKI